MFILYYIMYKYVSVCILFLYTLYSVNVIIPLLPNLIFLFFLITISISICTYTRVLTEFVASGFPGIHCECIHI